MIDRTCTDEKNQHTTFKKVAKNLNYKNNNNRNVSPTWRICLMLLSVCLCAGVLRSTDDCLHLTSTWQGSEGRRWGQRTLCWRTQPSRCQGSAQGSSARRVSITLCYTLSTNSTVLKGCVPCSPPDQFCTVRLCYLLSFSLLYFTLMLFALFVVNLCLIFFKFYCVTACSVSIVSVRQTRVLWQN